MKGENLWFESPPKQVTCRQRRRLAYGAIFLADGQVIWAILPPLEKTCGPRPTSMMVVLHLSIFLSSFFSSTHSGLFSKSHSKSLANCFL